METHSRVRVAAKNLSDRREAIAKLYKKMSQLQFKAADHMLERATAEIPWCLGPNHDASWLALALDVEAITDALIQTRNLEKFAYLTYCDTVIDTQEPNVTL